MKIIDILSTILSPAFLGTIAGLSLAATTILLGVGKRFAKSMTRYKNIRKLSDVEPKEYKGAGYLILAFGWAIFGLIFTFIFNALNAGAIRNIGISFSALGLFFALCFFYAGSGELLRALTRQQGGVMRKFIPPMKYIDRAIIWFGDFLTSGLFKN